MGNLNNQLKKFYVKGYEYKVNLYNILSDDSTRASFLIDSLGIYPEVYGVTERYIMPLYDTFYLENSHDRNHIYKVLANAIMIYCNNGEDPLYKNLDIDGVIKLNISKFNVRRDMNLIYLAVCCHDIGLNFTSKYSNTNGDVLTDLHPSLLYTLFPSEYYTFSSEEEVKEEFRKDRLSFVRKYHHILGTAIFKEIVYRSSEGIVFTNIFSDNELDIVSNSILHHRASIQLSEEEENNLSIIEKIVCQADRCFYYTDAKEVYKRACSGKKITFNNESKFSFNDMIKVEERNDLNKAIQHVYDKVNDKTGYAYNRIYFPEDLGYKRFRETVGGFVSSIDPSKDSNLEGIRKLIEE